MTSPITCLDSTKFSLSNLKELFLEEKDGYGAHHPACDMAQQLLFSNRISDGHALLLALSTFDASFSRNYPKYQPLGLNGGGLGLVTSAFFEYKSTLPRPTNVAVPIEPWSPEQSWNNYTQLCNLQYLPELGPDVEQHPFDVHQWRNVDDPTIITHCCLRLAAPPAPATYPPLKAMMEAVAAAQKLYAQAEPKTSDEGYPEQKRRHSQLINRVLAVELALRTGDKQTGLDFLVMAAKDGFGSLRVQDFLIIPGIYDLLPLLEIKGLEGNPHFISKEDAVLIVSELKDAMEARIANGRQVPMAKVGWRELLDRLANAAWEVNGKSYQRRGLKNAKDILYPPATNDEIAAAENKVGELPADFKAMVKVANGFKGGWHFLCGGMAGIRGIRKDETIEDLGIFEEQGVTANGNGSGNTIGIAAGAKCDGYMHYLIPHKAWKEAVTEKDVEPGEYFFFSWAASEAEVNGNCSVREWVVGYVRELENMVKNGEKEESGDEEDIGEDDSEIWEEDDNDIGREEDGEDEDMTDVDA